MTIVSVNCDLCYKIVAYTNKRIPERSHNYLDSDKLTNGQKWAFVKRQKFLYCVDCEEKEMEKAREEIRRENRMTINEVLNK